MHQRERVVESRLQALYAVGEMLEVHMTVQVGELLSPCDRCELPSLAPAAAVYFLLPRPASILRSRLLLLHEKPFFCFKPV